MEKRSIETIIVSPDTNLRKVVELISINGLRGVFVCDEDRELLGIIMDADIRRAILSDLDMDASVRTIMKTNPFTIHRGLSAADRRRALIESERSWPRLSMITVG